MAHFLSLSIDVGVEERGRGPLLKALRRQKAEPSSLPLAVLVMITIPTSAFQEQN